MNKAIVAIDNPLPKQIVVGDGIAYYISGIYQIPTSSEKPIAVYIYIGRSVYKAETCLGQRFDQSRTNFDTRGFWGILDLKLNHCVDEQKLSYGIILEYPDSFFASIPIDSVTLISSISANLSPANIISQGADVSICLAVYKPNLELFTRQIDSIKAQSYQKWMCIISDDSCDDKITQLIRDIIENDNRFVIYTNTYRLGVYKNFELLLTLVPSNIKYIALADQDDYWYPEKIDLLISRISSASVPLVYGDVRVSSETGEVLSYSAWLKKKPNEHDLDSQILTTSLYGATCLFKKDLLNHSLPFPPPAFGVWTHDRWIGSVAVAFGGMQYYPHPIQDYIQHQHNLFGFPNNNPDTEFAKQVENEMHLNESENYFLNEDFLISARNDYFNFVLRSQLTSRTLKLRCRQLNRKESFTSIYESKDFISERGLINSLDKARMSTKQKSSSLGMEYHLARGIKWKLVLEKVAPTTFRKGLAPLIPRAPDYISPLPTKEAYDDNLPK